MCDDGGPGSLVETSPISQVFISFSSRQRRLKPASEVVEPEMRSASLAAAMENSKMRLEGDSSSA